MIPKISKAISWVYHPLIIPTLGILVLFYSGTDLSIIPYDKKWILLTVFLWTYVIPLIFIPLFIYLGVILNVQMESRSERYIPMVVTFIVYMFCYYLVKRTSIPQPYHSFLLGSLICILVTMLVTLKYKISIHMVGGGGMIALVAYIAFTHQVDLQFYLGIAIVLAGLTGTARLILKAHTPDEVYTGLLTGFSVVLLTMVLG